MRYSISVCHEKKVVWYRVAKVGTRTIYDVFEKAGVEVHDEQVKFYSNTANLYPDYFKFAFVRNPWDRLVSCWKDKVVQYNYFRLSDNDRSQMKHFDYFVDCLADADLDHGDPHIRAQSKLVDINHLDFIGQFEQFSTDLRKIIHELELGEINIRKLNASDNRKNYRKYYNDALRQKVAELYRQDIEAFSYDF